MLKENNTVINKSELLSDRYKVVIQIYYSLNSVEYEDLDAHDQIEYRTEYTALQHLVTTIPLLDFDQTNKLDPDS